MFRSRHHYRVALAGSVAALAAALPAPALAATTPTFCVNAPDCPVGATDEGGNLEKAINDARTSGASTVLVGDAGGPYTGPFGAAKAADPAPVSIVADGPSRPVLTAPAGTTVLSTAFGSVQGIDVVLPDSASGVGINAGAGVSLSDVRVTGPGRRSGSGAIGIRTFGAGIAIDGSQISGTGLMGIDVVKGDATITHTSIEGVDTGVENGLDTANVVASRISAGSFAVRTAGTTRVVTSVLQTTGPHSFGVAGTGGGLTLDHDTIVHTGPTDGGDAALDFKTIDIPGRANISAVALAGYTRGILRDNSENAGTYPLAIRDSVWDPSHDVLGDPSAGPVQESADAHVAPALVDLARGDFRPRGSSAAIDRDALTNGRYIDIDGIATVDGNGDGTALADAGAFEYRRRSPSIDAADVPGAGATGAPLTFSSVGSDPDGDQPQTVWTFGDGAVGAGAQTTHTYAAPGVYRVALRLIDEAGLSTTRTFTVAITGGGAPAPASSPGPVGSVPAPPSPSGSHPRDHAAPHLQAVRLVPSRLRIAQAGGLRLRFRLDERAVIRIVAQRLNGARSVAVRGAIVASARAGNGSLALAAGLRRLHLLRAGRVLLRITATDAAGNRSTAALARLSITR